MEIVIQIAGKLVEYTFAPVGQWLCYSFHYDSNMENLKNQEKTLRAFQDKVQHSVVAASRNGEEIEVIVTLWLAKVDEATTKLSKIEEEAGNRSSNAACLNLKHRHQLSREAKQMVENIAQLLDEYHKNGNFEKVGYRPPPSEGMETTRNKDYMAMESRMTAVKGIMEALGNADIDKIGVWGMPGVGKSTLMDEIARKAMEEKLFNEVVMAVVTASPDVWRIQKRIAKTLGLNLDQETDEKRRASLLKQRLSSNDKKILVILDDIWKQLDLREIGIPSEGCKVVMTSRDRDVLICGMGAQKEIQLRILQEAEAFSLIKKIAGDSFEDQPEVSVVAIEIAKKCAGLPIALVAVSKVLKNKSLSEWRDRLRQLKRPAPEHIEEGPLKTIYHPIRVSYDNLESPELKSLFLLCALLPYFLPYRDLLIYSYGWDLFRGIYTLQEARDRLDRRLRELKDSCLLLESSDGFCMHDLVRDVATIIASSDNNMFVMRDEGGRKEWPDVDALKRCQAFSIIDERPDVDALKRCQAFSIFDQLPNEMECLELISLRISLKYHYVLKIPNTLFQGMEKLKVLDLKRMQLSSLPSSLLVLRNLQTLCLDDHYTLEDISGIGELKNLVVLSLRHSPISKLPREIGSLVRLQMLDLGYCSQLEMIPPNVISSLVKLEELYMGNSVVQWEVEGLNDERKNASLAELKHLSNLNTLEIQIPDVSKLPKDFNFEKLERYKICIGDVRHWSDSFQSSRTLKLMLNSSIQSEFWNKMPLKRVENLHLKGRLNGVLNLIPEIDREVFQQTKYLRIQNGVELKYIINLSTSVIVFPTLETFILSDMIRLEAIWQGELPSTSFKKLRVLELENCEKLRFVFSSSIARGFSLLEKLKIKGCKNMGAIVVKEEKDKIEDGDVILFRQLQTLTLEDLPELLSFLSTKSSFMTDCEQIIAEGSRDLHVPLLHHQLFFPSLKTLQLAGLPRIKHVWSKEIFRFQDLLHLHVDSCENLKSLFPTAAAATSLTQLKSLEIRDCGVLEEIVQREDGTDPTTKILFTSLTLLRLEGLPKLKWFFQGVRALESSSSKELHEQGGTLLRVDEVAFPKLTYLLLWNLPKIKHVWSKDPQTILSFQNLQNIDVSNCASLNSLFPASIGTCLKQLKEISIEDCGILEEIVEGEGGEAMGRTLVFEFPQVTSLVLENLPRLECFYKGLHISKWPMLKTMWIEKCEKVEVFASGLVSFEETVEERQCSHMSIKQPIFWVDEMSFPSLETLDIHGMQKLEIMWYGAAATSLTTLNISDCGSLEAVFEQHEGQNDSFPNLLDIHVQGCDSLKSLFPAATAATSLTQLKSLEIEDCGVMEEIVAREDTTDPTTRILFTSLTHLSLEGLPKLKWFFQGVRTLESLSSKELQEQGGTLFGIEEVAFPNLTTFYLRNLSKIKHVWSTDPQTILRFQNLRYIDVSKCASLNSLLPASIGTCLKQLNEIRIKDCGVLEEIVEGEGGEAVGRTLVFEFPQVTTLVLKNLPRLECFYKGLHISKWPILKMMLIKGCKKVEVFASELGSFEKTVEERQYSQMSIKQPLFLVDEMSFQSLQILKISKMEKLEIIWNIKDSHQRNMYSFPNLLHIDVSLCESLKSLFPAASVAASLSQLQSLMITGCGVMEEIFEREDGTDPTTRLLFPSLICLGLYGLPKLRWFFHGVRTLESSSSKELHEQGGTLFVVEEVAFPSLKLLDLYGLPKIKHIWSKDSQTIPSFQNLQVIIAGKCVSLKSLFPASIVRCLEQLEKIKIYDCGVEEIVAAEGGEVVEMTLAFPQVTSLCLENLGRLKGVHDSKWSMLKQMRILECEKVKLLFPSLVTLEIRRMYKLEIMSRNVTIRKLWRSCYARCLHANESYQLRRALMESYVLWVMENILEEY